MLRSMTSFARMEYKGNGWHCAMELRSVNGRFCDVNIGFARMEYKGDGWHCAMELRSVNGRFCDVNIGH